MPDPDNLLDAISLIREYESDRELLSDALNVALKQDKGNRSLNRVIHAHGEIRRMGRLLHYHLQWVIDNVDSPDLVPNKGHIVSLLAQWKDHPHTKFDGAHPIDADPGPSPGPARR